MPHFQSLVSSFLQVRKFSEDICEPLEIEDYGLQAIAETSPAKWHLAHTSWFFETFILKQYENKFIYFNKHFEYLFNSYYNGVGEQFLRANRALLSRPTVKEVWRYRENVTQRLVALLESFQAVPADIASLVTLGINHEQQHQELFYTDLLFNWSLNPLLPQYQSKHAKPSEDPSPIQWQQYSEQMFSQGVSLDSNQFVFDNETPKHNVYLGAFEVADRLITNGEFLAFMQDDGYSRPEFWLSDGWSKVQQFSWCSPLYWRKEGEHWFEYGLNGLQSLNMAAPVAHISAYEADAYARWADARLLTEFEWELVASRQAITGNFAESGYLQAQPVIVSAAEQEQVKQLFGDLWEWTSSAYAPYPGYKPAKGAVGEYNGKFMCNQLVLKGGSCVTSLNHIRSSYRNFFYPEARWQFSGLRLARNLK